VKDGVSLNVAKRRVFEFDLSAIRDCAMLIAVLDGRTIDEGVAFELGVAFSLGKICIGLQTDPRRLLPTGNNPMIDCALCEICGDSDELVSAIRNSLSHSFLPNP
jgi:nucleoside 2-deoxyribosyltransferase